LTILLPIVRLGNTTNMITLWFDNDLNMMVIVEECFSCRTMTYFTSPSMSNYPSSFIQHPNTSTRTVSGQLEKSD